MSVDVTMWLEAETLQTFETHRMSGKRPGVISIDGTSDDALRLRSLAPGARAAC